MRQLLPVFHHDADPVLGYGDPPRRTEGSRPYVLVNMISSVDGGTAANGLSGGLGSAGDRRIFAVLRSLADIILVGAQTVRAERYGPPRLDETLVARRLGRGQTPVPAIAVVSRSLQLDWGSPFFTEAQQPPLVVAPASASAEALARASDAAEVIVAGDDRVDVGEALGQLGGRGADVVLGEGGATLNAELLEHDLVDELCLTLSPALLGAAGGDRITGGAAFDHPRRLSITHVFEEDDFLFLRYAPALHPKEEQP
jgi:riboflavin biosynthesis pyrimidine reductase